LKLGAGFGNAIAVRGGSSIQEELNGRGPLSTGEVVFTDAGNLKSKFIIHAVGPRFQEEDTENKLRKTMDNILQLSEKKGIKKIAFPPMGYGFYGVPIDLCATVMTETINNHIMKKSSLEEIVIAVMDDREYEAFESKMTIKK
jgi:O-acetyl-ADP-ribose deacetylase (regulator of RNase III)